MYKHRHNMSCSHSLLILCTTVTCLPVKAIQRLDIVPTFNQSSVRVHGFQQLQLEQFRFVLFPAKQERPHGYNMSLGLIFITAQILTFYASPSRRPRLGLQISWSPMSRAIGGGPLPNISFKAKYSMRKTRLSKPQDNGNWAKTCFHAKMDKQN